MSLKLKLIYSAGALFLIYLVLNFILIENVLYPEFVTLEKKNSLKNIKLIEQGIVSEIKNIDTLCHDWATRDDTYEFVLSSYESNIDDYLPLSSFVDNNLNLIYIMNRDNQVIWGESYDFEIENKMEIDGFKKDQKKQMSLFNFSQAEGYNLADLSKNGVLVTKQGILLVASHPVLTNDNEGPVRGSVIVAKFLTQHLIDNLITQTQIRFSISIQNSDSIADYSQKGAFSKEKYSIVFTKNDQLVRSSFIYPDLYGKPGFLITSESPALIIINGKKTIQYIFIFIILGGILVSLLILYFIQRVVILPIELLTENAKAVTDSGDLFASIVVKKGDEIGKLACIFNTMLETIHIKNTELIKKNKDHEFDIIIIKKIEAELKERELYLKSLLESIPSGITVFDSQGIIKSMNHITLKLLNLDVTRDMSGTTLPESLITADEISKLGSCTYDIPLSFESEIRLGQHSIIPVLKNISKIRMKESDAFILNVTDLTEQKNAESEKIFLEKRLSQSRKMESIGTLAGGIAHDFNNILNILYGYVQLLNSVTESEKGREYIAQLMKTAERARDLVQQILTFSRQSNPEKIPCDLKIVTKETVKLIRASLPSSVEVKTDLESFSGIIMADQTQINQVIMNLCTNSFQAMKNHQGVIHLSLANVDMADEDDDLDLGVKSGEYVVLIIKDDGPGIDDDVILRIFEPYFTTKEKGSGTGMGLAIVHGIVRDHKGFISVSSSYNIGTEFKLMFPLIKTDKKRETLKNLKLERGNEKILIVDDEKENLTIFSEFLKELGYAYYCCNHPGKALDILKNEKFDLVVSDLTMPVMSGDELAVEIKKVQPDIPVIICSGFIGDTDRSNIIRDNIKAMIQKPVLLHEFSEIIRVTLDQK